MEKQDDPLLKQVKRNKTRAWFNRMDIVLILLWLGAAALDIAAHHYDSLVLIATIIFLQVAVRLWRNLAYDAENLLDEVFTSIDKTLAEPSKGK